MAVACGISKTDGAAHSTSSTSPKQNIAADTAAAQAANLRLSDFPPGWTSAPQSTDTGPAGIKAKLAKCLGVSQSALSEAPAHADSDDFSQSDSDMTASSTVQYEATSADQTAAFNDFASAKTPRCMTTAVTTMLEDAIKHPPTGSTLPAGVKFGQATVQQMSFPTYGDKTIAYQIKVPIDYNGSSLDAYQDFIVAIKGRAGAGMVFENLTDPFPADQEQHYTELVVGRLTNT
jgi:hypothetical protein